MHQLKPIIFKYMSSGVNKWMLVDTVLFHIFLMWKCHFHFQKPLHEVLYASVGKYFQSVPENAIFSVTLLFFVLYEQLFFQL